MLLFLLFLFLTFCCFSRAQSFFTSIASHQVCWHPNVSLRRLWQWFSCEQRSCACSWTNTWNNVNCACSITVHVLVLSTLLQTFCRGDASTALRCDTFLKKRIRGKIVGNDLFACTTLIKLIFSFMQYYPCADSFSIYYSNTKRKFSTIMRTKTSFCALSEAWVQVMQEGGNRCSQLFFYSWQFSFSLLSCLLKKKSALLLVHKSRKLMRKEKGKVK